MQPNIGIVILNWNGRDDTLECLDSVLKLRYEAFKVYVADNGSTDDSIPAISNRFPHIRIIENNANLGFAGGNNTAITIALQENCDYVLLLNNDTIVDSDILNAFTEAAANYPNGCIYGPKIYQFNNPEMIWYAGGYWNDRTLSFEEHGANQIDEGQFDVLGPTDWVIGCCMFIPRIVFDKVGLLETDYFLNNEEIDYCTRAKRAGFPCIYVPTARIWHKVSASFGGEHSPLKEYFSFRNRLLWAKRNTEGYLLLRIHLDTLLRLLRRYWSPLFRALFKVPPFSPKECWWTLAESLHDTRNRAATIGYFDYWRGRFGNCPDSIRTLNRQWIAQRSSIKSV